MRPKTSGEVRIAERDDRLGDTADDRGYRQAVQVLARYGSDGREGAGSRSYKAYGP